MKLNKIMLAILLSTVVGKSDIITLQWKSSPGLLKKYVTIPAGKVCKILTVSQYISFGNVDAAGGEAQVFEGGNYIITSQNVVTISGPAKIFFKKESSLGGLITLDIVDQNSPKSGVTFTDN